MPVETRGSNMSAGIEMASDAAPIRDIYKLYRPAAPVNSPWAALNFDTGTELAGWMSHIAEPPSSKIPFRYYVNDPWWVNSPWLDRYGREPWDIYLPLSVSSLDSKGRARAANSISILSVDDSYGDMPEQIPVEIAPHLLYALRCRPDAAGPLVWLYPFEEYHDLVFGSDRHPDSVFAEDSFIASAIQNGLPLNTVVGSKAFLESQPFGSVVFAPMSAMKGALWMAVEKFMDAGGQVLFYGPAENAAPALLKRLGISLAGGVEGEMAVETSLVADSSGRRPFGCKFVLYPQFCGGALRECVSKERSLATASKGAERRTIAAFGEACVWVRSLLTSLDDDAHCGTIRQAPPFEQFPVERLPRLALQRFGFHFVNRLYDADRLVPRFNISRCGNGFQFSGFCPDTAAELSFKLPQGAPVFCEMETVVRDGCSISRMPKSWRKECRLFVRSSDECEISTKERAVDYPGRFRCVEYAGLKNASLTFLPPPEAEGSLEALLDDAALKNVKMENGSVSLENVSGNLKFRW